MGSQLYIRGVSIDNISTDAIYERIRKFLHERSSRYIVTVNPEFVVAAQHDTEFMHIINRADLSVADGFGIAVAARLQGERLAARVAGVDMMHTMCAYASEQGLRVYLLGAKRGVPEQAAAQLTKKFPGLKIVGAECGYRRWHRHKKDFKLRDHINRARADILFVAFGQVKQEKWIYHNLPKLKSVKVAMGVGGSFDYTAGRVRRAPRWMRRIGLEWLFRLMRQPWRLPRIMNAVIRFTWLIIKPSFTKKV